MNVVIRPGGGQVQVERWHSEVALAVLIALIAAGIWLMLAVTIIGIVYAVFLGVFFWVGHLVFITHLRGNAVRLGPEQFPDLYHRVQELSHTVGLAEPPVAYVMEASGTLNALATRFLRTNFIVLFSDLLEACGDNDEARDFIIAHELGHVHAGHLRWRWLLLPGLMVPFLGTAYSRACEFTCDRYGFAVARDRERALRGLAILAAGGRRGAVVNLSALAGQRADLNTPLMQIGSWLSTHPPLCERLAVLEPSLERGGVISYTRAAAGAIAVLAGVMMAPIVASVVVIGAVLAAAGAAGVARDSVPTAEIRREAPQQPVEVSSAEQSARARRDIESLAAVVDVYRVGHGGELPRDIAAIYGAWAEMHPNQAPPTDPFDGDRYGYQVQGSHYRLWSAGPEIEYSSRTRGFVR